ncbi:hypothetical protein [Mangrovihabitans endophyticus]|nr:hypothetical protein [Mangrovihabitans endophyticus]
MPVFEQMAKQVENAGLGVDRSSVASELPIVQIEFVATESECHVSHARHYREVPETEGKGRTLATHGDLAMVPGHPEPALRRADVDHGW